MGSVLHVPQTVSCRSDPDIETLAVIYQLHRQLLTLQIYSQGQHGAFPVFQAVIDGLLED